MSADHTRMNTMHRDRAGRVCVRRDASAQRMAAQTRRRFRGEKCR